MAPEGVFQREKLSRKHNQPRLIKKGKVEGACLCLSIKFLTKMHEERGSKFSLIFFSVLTKKKFISFIHTTEYES